MSVSTIEVEVFHGHPAFRRPKQEAIRLVRRVLRGEGFHAAEIGVVFLGDRRMKTLNGEFLRHHYTTDVLSFPLSAPGERLDGEVYVNIDQAKRQAPEFGATTRNEI